MRSAVLAAAALSPAPHRRHMRRSRRHRRRDRSRSSQALEIAERESEIGRSRPERSGAGRRRAAPRPERVLPAAHRLRLLHPDAAEPVLGAARRRTTGPSRTGAGGVRRLRAAARPAGRGAARFAGGRGRVRQQRGPVRRPGRRPAVRPGEHLPPRPLVLADAVQRRPGQRPDPAPPTPACASADDRPHRGAGAAPARRDRRPTTTRRWATASSPSPQATLQQADTTLSQTQLARAGRQPVGVRSAARPGDPRQPAPGRDPAARGARSRLLPAQEAAQPAAGAAARSSPAELVDTAMVRTARLAELVDTPADTGTDVRAPVRQAGEAVTSQQGLLRVGAGAALAAGLAHLGLRRDRLSQRRLAVRHQLSLRLGGRGGRPGAALHRRARSKATSRWRGPGWNRRSCGCSRPASWPSSTRGTRSSSSRPPSRPGRRAPAPKSRRTAPTRSPRSAIARGSRPRPS